MNKVFRWSVLAIGALEIPLLVAATLFVRTDSTLGVLLIATAAILFLVALILWARAQPKT